MGRRAAAAIEARARGGRRVRAARGDDERDHRGGRTDARGFEPPRMFAREKCQLAKEILDV